jgi:integrase
MATIESYETSKGRRYRVRYRTPDRRQTDKRGFRTKRDAEAFAATVEVSKLRGEFIDATEARAMIGALGPAWLERKKHVKPSTYRPLESAWRVHVEPHWGTVTVADVRKSEVQAWVTELGSRKGATTVLRAHGVLASILDDAVSDRRVLANLARGVSLPRKVRKERTYLTHEQVAALATAAGKRATLVYTLAYCGLRWGEAVGLRVSDLDLLRRRLTVNQNAVEVGRKIHVGTPKGHERRTVPIPEFVVERVARQCEGKGRGDLVFPGTRTTYLPRPSSKDGWFIRAVEVAEIGAHMTPHDLRHTAASLAVSAGANVKALQRMLGHASASMTLDVYADLFDDDLDAVAVALNHAASISRAAGPDS